MTITERPQGSSFMSLMMPLFLRLEILKGLEAEVLAANRVRAFETVLCLLQQAARVLGLERVG